MLVRPELFNLLQEVLRGLDDAVHDLLDGHIGRLEIGNIAFLVGGGVVQTEAEIRVIGHIKVLLLREGPVVGGKSLHRIAQVGGRSHHELVADIVEVHRVGGVLLYDVAVLVDLIVDALDAVCQDVDDLGLGGEELKHLHAAGDVGGILGNAVHSAVDVVVVGFRVLVDADVISVLVLLREGDVSAHDGGGVSVAVVKVGALAGDGSGGLVLDHHLVAVHVLVDAEKVVRGGLGAGLRVLRNGGAHDTGFGGEVNDPRSRLVHQRDDVGLILDDVVEVLLEVGDRVESVGIIVVLVDKLLVDEHVLILAYKMVVRDAVGGGTDLGGGEEGRMDVCLEDLGVDGKLLVESGHYAVLDILEEVVLAADQEDIHLDAVLGRVDGLFDAVGVDDGLVDLGGLLGGGFGDGGLTGGSSGSGGFPGGLCGGLGFGGETLLLGYLGLDLLDLLGYDAVIFALFVEFAENVRVELGFCITVNRLLDAGDVFLGCPVADDRVKGDRHGLIVGVGRYDIAVLIGFDFEIGLFVAAARQNEREHHEQTQNQGQKSLFHLDIILLRMLS